MKHVIETTEVEEGVTTIRRCERFSNELLLVFASGETQILSETDPAKAAASGAGEEAGSVPATTS